MGKTTFPDQSYACWLQFLCVVREGKESDVLKRVFFSAFVYSRHRYIFHRRLFRNFTNVRPDISPNIWCSLLINKDHLVFEMCRVREIAQRKKILHPRIFGAPGRKREKKNRSSCFSISSQEARISPYIFSFPHIIHYPFPPSPLTPFLLPFFGCNDWLHFSSEPHVRFCWSMTSWLPPTASAEELLTSRILQQRIIFFPHGSYRILNLGPKMRENVLIFGVIWKELPTMMSVSFDLWPRPWTEGAVGELFDL